MLLLAGLLLAPGATAAMQASPEQGESHPAQLAPSTRLQQSEDGLFDNLTILLGSNRISGQARDIDKAGEAIVTATQWDESGRSIAISARPTSSDGNVELSFEDRGIRVPSPQPILAGQRIHFSVDHADLEQREQWLDVPQLSIEADAETDRVEGIAPAGARVYLMATDRDGAFQRQSVDAGEDGRFEAEFAPRMDVTEGSSGNALILQDGVAFQASWALTQPVIAVGSTFVDMVARPGERGIIVVEDADGQPKARGEAVDHGGELRIHLRDAAGQLMPILPGDRVIIQMEWAGLIHELSDMRIPTTTALLDTETETIRGWTTAEQRLQMEIFESADEGEATSLGLREVVADESGRWALDLSGEIDLSPDSLAVLRFPDLPGVQLGLRSAQARNIDAFDASLDGQGQAGAWVQLAQHADGDETPELVKEGYVGADGRFALTLLRPESGPSALQAGKHLRLSQTIPDADSPESTVRESLHPDLPIEVFPDTVNQQISGRALPGAVARVWLPRQGLGLEGPVDPSGRFAINLLAGAPESSAELVSGSEVELTLWDRQRDIERNFAFTAFRMNPQIESAKVHIEGYPGMEAAIELEREGTILGHGRCRVERTHCLAEMRDEAGETILISIDDQLFSYPDLGETGHVEIVDMTAHVDRGGRDVVGEAPPYKRVSIEFHNDQGDGLPLDTVAGVDDMGVYDYELSATEWDLLLPGLESSVFYGELGNHRTMARAVIEAIRLYLDDSVVRGHAEPGTGFELRLERPVSPDSESGNASGNGVGDDDSDETQVLAVLGGHALYDGRYEIPLADALKDAGTQLRVGDKLIMKHKRGQRSLTVPPLVGWAVEEAGGIAGLGAPFAQVRARHHLRAGSGQAEVAQVDVAADREGIFYLPAPAVSPSEVSRVELMAFAGDDDRVFRTVDMSGAIPRVYLPSVWGK